MERPIEAVDLAAHGGAGFFIGQRFAWKFMKMLAMPRKKSAAPCGHSAAKSGRRGDLRFARAAGLYVAERICEVLDWGLNDTLEKHAIVAHFLVDFGSRRLRQGDVRRRVPADRHQRMGGGFAK